MSYIVERLQAVCSWHSSASRTPVHLCHQAATEIERLRAALATARNDALEEAAKVAKGWYARMHKAGWPSDVKDAPDEIADAIEAMKGGDA